MQTTAAHTAINTTLDAALTNRSWATQPFRTFRQFANAVAANLAPTATQDEAAHLCAILTVARDSNGTLATRMSYASHLARHAAADPISR